MSRDSSGSGDLAKVLTGVGVAGVALWGAWMIYRKIFGKNDLGSGVRVDPDDPVDDQLDAAVQQLLNAMYGAGCRGLKDAVEKWRHDTGKRFPVTGAEVVLASAQPVLPSHVERLMIPLLFGNIYRLAAFSPVQVCSVIRDPAGDKGNHSRGYAIDFKPGQACNAAVALSKSAFFINGGFGTYDWGIHYDRSDLGGFANKRRWSFYNNAYHDYLPTVHWWFSQAELDRCIATLQGWGLQLKV